MQDAQFATLEAGRVISLLERSSAGLDAGQANGWFLQEIKKEADGIASASHTGNHLIGQFAFRFKKLDFGFFSYHFMKIPNHAGVGVGAQGRA